MRFRILLFVLIIVVIAARPSVAAQVETIQVDLGVFNDLRVRPNAYELFRALSLKPHVTAFVPIADASAAPSVVPVAANGTWHTDLFAVNRGATAVTQKVGHQRFSHPGLNDIIIEPTVTLQPGETKWLRRVDLNFDADYRQVPGCYDTATPCGSQPLTSNPGFYILGIESGIEASVVLEYPGVTNFEVAALTKAVNAAPDIYTYQRVGSDFLAVKNGVEYPARGAFATFLNLGAPTRVTLRVFDNSGANPVDESFIIGAGITQTGIRRPLSDGGRVIMYLGTPGASGGGSLPAPFYMFIAQGPPDGKQQSIRYPE